MQIQAAVYGEVLLFIIFKFFQTTQCPMNLANKHNKNACSAGRPKIHSIVLQSPNKPDTSDLQRIGTTRVYILGAYVAGKERKSILIQT